MRTGTVTGTRAGAVQRSATAAVLAAALAGVLAGCASASQEPRATASLVAPAGGGPSTEAAPATGARIAPVGPVAAGVPVLRVVDGDTVHVLLAGQDVTVRILAIDTPETVKPGSPVECYGPEASQFAHESLDGRTVTLEQDPSQDAEDRYGRTLAHVWIEEADGSSSLYGEAAVAGGFAQARVYGGQPSAWAGVLDQAQAQARRQGLGMWGACAVDSP